MNQQIEKSFLITFLSIIFPIILVFLTFIIYPDLAMRPVYFYGVVSEPRLGGDIVPPNTLGGMAAVASIMTIGLNVRATVKLLIIGFLLYVIFMTQSRMAFFSLFLSIVIIISISRVKYRYKFLSALFVFISITLGTIYLPDIISFLPERVLLSIGTIGGRTNLWTNAVSIFFDSSFGNLIFGFGHMLPGTTFSIGSLTTRNLHNGYLQVLFGTGIPTLCVYIALLLFTLRANAGKNEMAFSLRCLAVFNIIWNISELGAGVKLNIFTIILALLISAPRRIKWN